ncbi:SMP-30/gluconolactonase/LRE family protein [Leeia oryzae]|uniref:SMP-30/gluconolactonase/LRE family protein n=1 Tax=Leeia oryzae TaxID=356662 RepID=UPI0005277E7B|nr:SMP-30/gluconolactonase/LRE family protein [Leeia oryzae]
MEARLLLDVRATLGEGLLWSARDQRLYFVDIKAPALHALDLTTGQHQQWPMPALIGWIIEREQGGFVAGLQDGFAFLSLTPTLELVKLINPHPQSPDMRLNDAKATASGQIFAGTMHNLTPEIPAGCLYRLDPDLSLHTVDTNYQICNGPCISKDQRTLYHTDTLKQTIYAYDLAADGSLSHRRVWLQFTETDGFPDGMTVDTEGAIWVAHWGGSCVSRFAPDGTLLRRVPLPVSQVTNLAFAGDRLDRLIVTSARDGLSAADLAKEPLAGGLFEIDPQGVTGLPAQRFQG